MILLLRTFKIEGTRELFISPEMIGYMKMWSNLVKAHLSTQDTLDSMVLL